MPSFYPREVGLTVKGQEPAGNGYARQPFAGTVKFGPAEPEGWGYVDGLFVTDGDQSFPAKLEATYVGRGTVLTVDTSVELQAAG